MENNLSVKLGNNPFQCSCSNVDLLELVQQFRAGISDHENVTLDCQHSQTQQIIFLRAEDICKPFEVELIIIGLSLLLVATVVLIFCCVYRDLIIILIFSHPWGRSWFSEDLLDNRKEYDVFLSYANQDSQYVEDILLSGLERPEKAEAQRYKCLIHSRDWAPGTAIPDQILQSVDSSRRTVIVLSNNYLQSMWSNMEFQAAHVKTMEENIQRVIIVLLGEMPDTKDININMMKYIKTKSYIDSQDPWFWKKLRYQLDKKTSKQKTDSNKFSNVNQDPVTPTEEKEISYSRPLSSEFLISVKKNRYFDCLT